MRDRFSTWPMAPSQHLVRWGVSYYVYAAVQSLYQSSLRGLSCLNSVEEKSIQREG